MEIIGTKNLDQLTREVRVARSKKSKRGPKTELMTLDPNRVDEVLSTNGRKTLRFRDQGSGYFLGSNGKFVRLVKDAKRFNPAEAREFLAKTRRVRWEAH